MNKTIKLMNKLIQHIVDETGTYEKNQQYYVLCYIISRLQKQMPYFEAVSGITRPPQKKWPCIVCKKGNCKNGIIHPGCKGESLDN